MRPAPPVLLPMQQSRVLFVTYPHLPDHPRAEIRYACLLKCCQLECVRQDTISPTKVKKSNEISLSNFLAVTVSGSIQGAFGGSLSSVQTKLDLILERILL
jgi:hypothetical protein